jgi:hypothetical protein
MRVRVELELEVSHHLGKSFTDTQTRASYNEQLRESVAALVIDSFSNTPEFRQINRVIVPKD